MSLSAQTVDIDWIELTGDKVVLHYNLDDTNVHRQYMVNLFTSKDNFTSPLTRVTGDVGTEVKPGADRKIMWDITKEFGAFKGNLSFEVRGRIFVPFVKLANFDEGKVFKRGKGYPITWTSGNLGSQVNIELFNNKQERVMGENNLPNSGKYEFYIPASTKSGTNYRLKFTNTKDRNDIQYSNPFIIKPKLPALIKAAGIAAIGAAVYTIANLGKGSVSSSTPPENPLVVWPGTP
jgi:hypothetical protein